MFTADKEYSADRGAVGLHPAQICAMAVGWRWSGDPKDQSHCFLVPASGRRAVFGPPLCAGPAGWPRSLGQLHLATRLASHQSCQRFPLDHTDLPHAASMREIVHLQAGQCGNQIGAKVGLTTPISASPRPRAQSNGTYMMSHWIESETFQGLLSVECPVAFPL